MPPLDIFLGRFPDDETLCELLCSKILIYVNHTSKPYDYVCFTLFDQPSTYFDGWLLLDNKLSSKHHISTTVEEKKKWIRCSLRRIDCPHASWRTRFEDWFLAFVIAIFYHFQHVETTIPCSLNDPLHLPFTILHQSCYLKHRHFLLSQIADKLTLQYLLWSNLNLRKKLLFLHFPALHL